MAKKTLDGSKPYVAWDKPGQVIEGIFRKMQTSRGDKKGFLIHLEDENGDGFICSAPVALAEMVADNIAYLQDNLVTIEYTSQDAPKVKGQSGVKRFKLTYDDGKPEE